MNAIDVVRAGDPLPRIASISAREKFAVSVRWRVGREQIVDLAPDIFTYKFYRPSVERLACEGMEPSEFSAFLKRHHLTFDAAAAQLGPSRRLIAYYASERRAPRHVALACAFLDSRLALARRR